ncbi:hypothetical protein OKA05_15075 [Luteolibacter arcticus]|uniref:DNA polymerase III alpha subunit finger domain-containing protein n=1 Tax=Luteolibacter arcticus TaxID=1581411 RepID=A0ABT3GK43_9BACT|nr:hypothetical protein [Luteolibacter arcticus]MCW1923889.1 hypothetical protein [Luteolibacter arcticus]
MAGCAGHGGNVGEMRHPYLNRRTGIEPVDHIHLLCQPILKRTLGVIRFQEQILRIAMDVAGFAGAEADELRRAMGSKRSRKKMGQVVEKLRRGGWRSEVTMRSPKTRSFKALERSLFMDSQRATPSRLPSLPTPRAP